MIHKTAYDYKNKMSDSPYKMSYTSAHKSVRDLIMYNADDTLSSYVRRIIHEKGLNLREVSERARKAGYKISHATVGDIIKHPERRVEVRTVIALAHGIGEPEQDVLRVASGLPPQHVSEYKKRLCEQLYNSLATAKTPEMEAYLERSIKGLLRDAAEDHHEDHRRDA